MRPIYDPELAKIRERCGDLFSIQSRIERAMILSSIPGLDQTAAACSVGWSQQWVNRRLDPEKMQRHKTYNVAWTRQKRLRERMEKEQIKAQALVDAVAERLAPAIESAIKDGIVAALHDSEYGQSVAFSLASIAEALEAKNY